MKHFVQYKEALKALRLPEILLMTGFSFIGVLFTNEREWGNPNKDVWLFLFVLFYVMTVYFLNSFAGYNEDVQSQRLRKIGLFSRQEYVWFFFLFFFLFVIVGLLLNMVVLGFAVIALLLWAVYYLPPLHLKSTMLLGTVVHFFAGILHFHTGYCSFDSISGKSITISVFYALLLCVGHIHHEIIDYSADKNAGNRTTAVRIGVQRMYFLRTALILFAGLCWIVVYQLGYVSATEWLLFSIPVFVLFVVSLFLRSEDSSKKFQIISRRLFLIAGLGLFFIKIGAFVNRHL